LKLSLILLHGAISSGKQFDRLLPLLNKEFDVHIFSFPGHGGKEIPSEPFSIDLFASALLEYLHSEKISSASVFGYSMGGYVALYLASRHPLLFNKIFTLGTKLEWTEDIAAKETSQLNPEKIEAKVLAFAEALKQLHSPEDWKTVLHKTSELLINLGRNPILNEKDFQKIKIPVLIGLGDEDKMVSKAESENAVNQLKHGRLLLLPETHHVFEKVNQHVLAEYINDFFVR
jgi:pimeloyl-ACP methyl ester carboxylesterase